MWFSKKTFVGNAFPSEVLQIWDAMHPFTHSSELFSSCLPGCKVIYNLIIWGIWLPIWWLMLIIAIPLRRSWHLEDLRKVFMSLSLEKLLSAVATVTGRVQAILSTTQRFGYNSHSPLSCIWISSSNAVVTSLGSSASPWLALSNQYLPLLHMWVFFRAGHIALWVTLHPVCGSSGALRIYLLLAPLTWIGPPKTGCCCPPQHWKTLFPVSSLQWSLLGQLPHR